jgi:hypothetical protein
MSLKIKYKPEELSPEELFISNLSSGSLGAAAVAHPKATQLPPIHKPGYGCHAWFYSGCKKWNHIVNWYRGGTKEADLFIQWLTEPKGPFKTLWDYNDAALIMDPTGKIPRGVSLGEKSSMHPDWGLIMSLCIMMRVPQERDQLLKSWYELVTKWKMDPAMAYYMSKGFMRCTSDPHKDKFIALPHTPWNGAHEVFNETTGPVDLKGFAKGVYRIPKGHDPSSYLSGIIWNFKPPGKNRQAYVSFPFTMYAKQEKTGTGGWGTLNLISDDVIPKIIKDFTAFVEARYE